MRYAVAGSLAFVVLVAASQVSTATVIPREVKKHALGTKVTFAFSHADGKLKPAELPTKAADRIISIANRIQMRDRPVAARKFQEAPIGSFTIGEGTWLHLHKGGRLEDPSYQGLQDLALKRLGELLLQPGVKLDEIFLRWVEELDGSDPEADRKSK